MSSAAKKILESALCLRADERKQIAYALWSSLEHGDDKASVEEAWEEEIARRSSEIDAGHAELVSWEEVRAEIARRLGER